jgi:hypothetical protein
LAVRRGIRLRAGFSNWYSPFGVIAGLDPAIHLAAKKMDPRVKPGGDDLVCGE